jgi:hypothetical protein
LTVRFPFEVNEPMSLLADWCDIYNARGSFSSELSWMRMMVAEHGYAILFF